MRLIVTASLPLLLGLWLPACAHAPTEEESAAPDAYDAQVALLRQQNATLREQVRSLEERMRFSGATASADGSPDTGPGGNRDSASSRGGDRHLPVVKLEPKPGINSPGARQAVTLSPLPYSSPYQMGDEDLAGPSDSASAFVQRDAAPSPTPAPAAVEVSSGESGVKSYKLVGNRLVNLTKKPRPAKMKPRPRRTSKAKKNKEAVIAQYDDAMGVYRAGRHAEAEVAFASIVQRFPRHEYADNALYWKGEAAYDQSHYADALASFTEVVERYGGGNKAPDALLKIGLCYGKLGDNANARDVLTQLIAAYPKAQATRIAEAKLSEF